MKYRRLLYRLAKLIPNPRPVTIRVRWVDSFRKPPANSDPPTPNRPRKPPAEEGRVPADSRLGPIRAG